MIRFRGLIYGAAAALLFALSPTLRAQNRLDAETLKLYGGTYSTDCGDPKATRLTVVADALIVDEQGRRVTGRSVQAAHAFFGQAAPPEYQIALMSDVQGSQRRYPPALAGGDWGALTD